MACLALVACLVGVGAWLWNGTTPSFPDPPPEPHGSANVRTTTGYDKDDPVTYTASVIDFPGGAQPLYDFYRHTFAESTGWHAQPADPADGLCLVNTTEAGSVRVLEARPFEGSPEARQPNRFLVVSSDFDGGHWVSGGICGQVGPWLDCEIETWYFERKDGTVIPCYDPRAHGTSN